MSDSAAAKAPHILCIGIPVRDLVFKVKALPPRGDKAQASHFEEICGGNALNAAIAISRLDGRVSMCGPMGHESERGAEFLFEQLAREGIATDRLVHMPDIITPISNVMIDDSGERTIVTFRDPRLWDVKLPDADDLLDGVDAILTESRCAGFVTGVCAEAKARGIPVVIDADLTMSLREGLLSVSSHIIFSREALHATANVTDDAQALRRIAAVTSAFVAVTAGPAGMIWLDEHGAPQHMPAFPVHTVDTLGAGDVFHGAFTLAMAEGQGIRDAMRFASAAAALKCTRFGGAFAAPDRAEVAALLARGSTVAG